MATQIWTVTRRDHGIVGSYSDMERALDAIGTHGSVEPSRGRAVSGMEHWEYGDYLVDVSTLDAPISPEIEAGMTQEDAEGGDGHRPQHQSAGQRAAQRAAGQPADRPKETKPSMIRPQSKGQKAPAGILQPGSKKAAASRGR